MSLSTMMLYAIAFHNLDTKLASDIVCTTAAIIGAAGLFLLPYHPKHYGLNLYNLKQNLSWGIGIGIALSIISVGIRIWLVKMGYKQFEFYPHVDATLLIYPIFALSQELVIKGYFQSYFIALLKDNSHGQYIAILIASLVFGQLHVFMGMPVAAVTFLYALISGIIYEKSRSILGLTIIHTMVGLVFLNWSKVM